MLFVLFYCQFLYFLLLSHFEFSKVNLSKVKIEVLKPWVDSKIKGYLGQEDEVVSNLIINTLESKDIPVSS